MSISTSCPGCKALFRLPEEMVGKLVRCQKCAGMFVVPKSEGSTTTPGLVVPSGAPPVVLSAEAEANPASPAKALEPPPAPQATAYTDGEQVASPKPPPPRRDYDPDEPSPRPRRRTPPPKSNSGMLTMVLVLIGGGLFACIACSGVAGFFFYQVRQVNAPIARKDRAIFKDAVKPPIAKIEDFKPKDFAPIPKIDFGPGPNVDAFKGGPPNPGFAKPFAKNMPAPDLDFFLKNGQPQRIQREFVAGKNGFIGVKMNVIPIGGIPVAFDAAGKFRSDQAITINDPRTMFNKFTKQYVAQFNAGEQYQIDMVAGFDAYLYLVNDANVVVAQDDDDGGVGLNARITFEATRTAAYRIQATSFGAGQTGDFTLVVQRLPKK